MTLNIQILPDNVTRDLEERGHSISDIEQMSIQEAFQEFLEWNGIIGYDRMIAGALLGIIQSDANYACQSEEFRAKFAAQFPKSRW